MSLQAFGELLSCSRDLCLHFDLTIADQAFNSCVFTCLSIVILNSTANCGAIFCWRYAFYRLLHLDHFFNVSAVDLLLVAVSVFIADHTSVAVD